MKAGFRLKSFRGGIHPPDNKGLTEGKEIRRANIPSSVRLPLKQNAGNPPRLVVEVGQRVGAGEKLASASAALSAPLHSSISGTVTKIASMPVPYRGKNIVVEIEGDGKDERAWGRDIPDPLSLAPWDIIGMIKEAGVVGMGGAEFPTHYKLSPPPEKKLDSLIVNAAECEPYLTADYRVMMERADDVVTGVRLLMKAAGVSRAYIGMERNKPDAFEKIAVASASVPGISPVMLKTKYPQGAEKQLIEAITGREVPAKKGLPADVGVIVQNVGTALAVFEACRFGKPLFERVVTVSGTAVKEPGNWLVRIGTSFAELVEQCGGLTEDAEIVIMGGPMMGIAQWTLDVPVVKGTTGILALSDRETTRPRPRPCSHCGQCLRACPMRLSPSLMRRAAEKGLWEKTENYGVMECIECGACAYVCGTSRDLVQLYRHAKIELQKRSCEVER